MIIDEQLAIRYVIELITFHKLIHTFTWGLSHLINSEILITFLENLIDIEAIWKILQELMESCLEKSMMSCSNVYKI